MCGNDRGLPMDTLRKDMVCDAWPAPVVVVVESVCRSRSSDGLARLLQWPAFRWIWVRGGGLRRAAGPCGLPKAALALTVT